MTLGTNFSSTVPYLAADEVEDALSRGDCVDVIGLVPGAVVHPHQHVPFFGVTAAVRVDAGIYKAGVRIGKIR